MLPINPNIFDTDITFVMYFLHRAENAGVINRVLLEARLQTVFARAAGMEVRGVRNQRLNRSIGQAAPRKMGIVESECQAGNAAHEARCRFWPRNNRPNVRFNAEGQLLLPCLFNSPRQFVTRSTPRIS